MTSENAPELRVYLLVRDLQPQFAAYLGTPTRARGYPPFAGQHALIVEVAIQAEVMNHHPEFHNSYNTLSFSFCTHDAGMKITDLDIETAKHISALARRFQSMA